MSKRVDLQSLGAKAVERSAPAEPTVPAPPRAEPTAQPATPRRKKPSATSVRFDELDRKETRLRADQVEALAQLAKRLNRARNRSGERITENTLIRVAVDLLMSQERQVAGTTETELRKSVHL